MTAKSLSVETDLALIKSIATGELDPLQLTATCLASLCQALNSSYRAGKPLVSDTVYDELFIESLRTIDPENTFLHSVEPEGKAFGGPSVRHDRPMLSTEKAYTEEEVGRFMARLTKTSGDLGMHPSELRLRATPKLDGIACRDNGSSLATRGDGFTGTDITHILARGAIIAGGERGQGDGEVVVVQEYFESVLKPNFDLEHPRNYITGFCGAETEKEHHRQAAEAQAVVFVPYSSLRAWEGTAEEFLKDWKGICDTVRQDVPYLMDGVIVEAIDPDVKAALGATSHHHRWMLAVKEKGETATTRAKDVVWQTGRTGRVTPVVELEPIYLSGANIARVTAHHAGMIKSLGIGPGAILEIIRSGEVIPKIERVITPADTAIPERCPCCDHTLELDGDFLVCPNNLECSAQVSTGLVHFFKTLGNVDLFGPKAVEILVDAGITDLREIYELDQARLQSIGFGPGQSANLVRELARSQQQEIEDWRFLAAFGIRHLGRGDSRRLLEGLTLEQLLTDVTPESIRSLDGFGEITSRSIAADLVERAALIADLSTRFTLRRTGAAAPREERGNTPLSGRGVVFTGAMSSGSREELQEQARQLGANVQTTVNSKTSYLVCGERVGSSKTNKAAALGVTVLSEAEYLALIRS